MDILENKSDTLEKFCNVELEKDGENLWTDRVRN